MVCRRDVAHGFAVQHRLPDRLAACGRQAVVEAGRQRTRIAVAGAAGVLADLFSRGEFEHAQCRAVLAQHAQCVERHGAAGGLRGQEEQLVGAVRGPAFQQGKERGDRLADAGRCLRDQAALGRCSAVDAFCQFTLTGSKAGVRKRERRQVTRQRGAMQRLLPRPCHEAAAKRFEVGLQVAARAVLLEHGFVAAVDIEVDQRDRDVRQCVLLAQHGCIGAGLGPVQCAMVALDGVELATKRLDLFDAGKVEIEAIGTAPDAQATETRRQRNLALKAWPAPRLNEVMAGDAFLRAGGGSEAQVEIACLGREGAQRLDGHRDVDWVEHGPRRDGHASRQRVGKERHGISCTNIQQPSRRPCVG